MAILNQLSLFFIVCSIGLSAHWRDITEAVRNPGGIARALVAVNLVVPLTALIVLLVLPIEPLVKVGIFAMAVSPIAPAAGRKMLGVGADGPRVVAVFALLLAAAVVIVPVSLLIVRALIPAAPIVRVATLSIIIIPTLLLPLALGSIIHGFAPEAAQKWSAPIGLVGSLGVLPGVVVALAHAGPLLITMWGNGVILAIVVTVVAGLIAGHMLGGPVPAHRNALALAAATRHPGIATLIVKSNYADPRPQAAVMLFLLIGVLLSVAYQIWARNSATRIIGVAAQPPI